jgi:hypothetical protein
MTISMKPVVLVFAGYLFLSALAPAAFAGDS